MIVADLSPRQLAQALAGPGLRLRTGPLVTQLRSSIAAVRAGVGLHYAHHPVAEAHEFTDFHVQVDRPPGLRRWLRPQVTFSFDGEAPFTPLPGDQGMPMLEWGLNWCISGHCHHYLIIHAAVVERGGRALILPAPPGSGKSTLCAALVARGGWRLLSDELALIDPASGELAGLARPVGLKNASIEVIRSFAPQVRLGPVVHETNKGSVAHMQPPADSVARADRPARPAWVVLPRFIPAAPATLEPLRQAEAFMALVDNAFNYHLHGGRGFETLARLIDGCSCYRFSYHRLDEALATFAALAEPH